MPRKRIRRDRQSQAEFCVFKPGGGIMAGGVTFVRRISAEKGDSLVAQGKAKRYDSADGECLGYELIIGQSEILKPTPLRELGRCVVLSKAEAEAVAGLRGKSRTANLPKHRREERIARGMSEMDLVETAKRKFHAMFPDREPEPTF